MRGTRIHVLAHWISPPGIMSGSTRILIEFIRRWSQVEGIQITVHTSVNGAETLKVQGVPPQVACCLWDAGNYAWSYNPLNHARQVAAAIRNVAEISDGSDTKQVIYSASEFWPDVIPAALLRRRLPRAAWLASFYLFAPNPFGGYGGEHESRLRELPQLRLLLNKYLYQTVTLRLIVRRSDLLLITNECDAGYFLARGFAGERIRAVYGGVDLSEAAPLRAPEYPTYDGCFVGRLHEQKGIEDLLRIWCQVCELRPQSRLAIVGSGFDASYVARMRKLSADLGLEDSADWLGYVDGSEKYEILKRSRVFLHTTVYDNSGMAAAEAMAAGLPVVAYDLPPLRVPYPKGMIKVPPRDIVSFARAVLALLTDKGLYDAIRDDAQRVVRDWDWDKRAADALLWVQHERDPRGSPSTLEPGRSDGHGVWSP